jgi:hypothetical protein
MSKAAQGSSTRKHDVLAMIKRHAEMYREMDRLYEVEGDNALGTKEYLALRDDSMDLEKIVSTARVYTSDEYREQVKFINRVEFSEDNLVKISWRLGHSARALGIRTPPQLFGWDAISEMSPRRRARHTARGLAEIEALAAA